MNCKNSVTRSLQKMSGVSADVDLKPGVAHVEATRELSLSLIHISSERYHKQTGRDRAESEGSCSSSGKAAGAV